MYIPHPCYDPEAHYKIGRIHLPVAPFCNIQCNYCVRQIKSREDRPGVTDSVITPKRALKRLKAALTFEPRIQIAAIAGPGDPLANDATFETFSLIKQELPQLHFCLSTNGLLLVEKLSALKKAGVKYITVTVNAVSPEIAQQIYAHVTWKKRVYKGLKAAQILLERQLEGIYQAARLGFTIKVNSVFIPNINGHHLVEVAKEVKTAGAHIMNIMPLIPVGNFSQLQPPTVEELKKTRAQCASIIKQWYLCKQCRADAVGVPGEEECSQLQLSACPQSLIQGVDRCYGGCAHG